MLAKSALTTPKEVVILNYLIILGIKDHDLDPELVEKAINSMKMRYKYDYSICDFTYNLLFPFKCIGRK